MLQIIRKSGQTVSTRLASEIASKLATGLIKPITAQLDPYRIGMAQRGLEVTKVYGRQLANIKNLHGDADSVVEHLVTDYPTHAFVIDREEAVSLFKNVDGFSEHEQNVFDQFRSRLLRPSSDPFIVNFASLVAGIASKPQSENEHAEHADPEDSDRENSASRTGKLIEPASGRRANGRQTASGSKGKPSGTPAEESEGTRLQ